MDINANIFVVAVILAGLFMLGILFIPVWRKEQDSQRLFELEKMRVAKQLDFEYATRSNSVDDLLNRKNGVIPVSQVDYTMFDGYIIINVEEAKRKMFEDVLKGFEDFAELKGYKISFSVDNSEPNKFAFKFTIYDQGVQVSSDTVKKDIRDYLDMVEKGQPFTDLPIIIPIEQHKETLANLMARMEYLEKKYNKAEKKVKVLQALVEGITKVHVTPNFHISTTTATNMLNGKEVSMQNYKADNSKGIIQGTGNNENIIDVFHSKTLIRIESSFNGRKAQLAEMQELINYIKALPTSDNRDDALHYIKAIHGELEEADKPDPTKIEKMFDKASIALKGIEIGEKLFQHLSKVFISFNLQEMCEKYFSNLS